jgi:integrase
MTKDPALPERVFIKGRWYYLVVAEGKKRVWKKLSKVADGLAAMYIALGELLQRDTDADKVPALIAAWLQEVSAKRSSKQHGEDTSRCRKVAARFADFLAADVEPPDVVEFLKDFRETPRTYNAYRALVGELMRFAIEKGYRAPGTNPVTAVVRTMKTPPRTRYITDSELRRIKVAAIGRRPSVMKPGSTVENAGGRMLCALIDMAYLTGQALGDLLALEWDDFRDDGILFARSKVEHSTGARVVIQWTPRLVELEQRLRAMRKARRGFGAAVFVKASGDPYTASGLQSAWERARDRAGVSGCTFHDIKAKALTDKEAREGMRAASAMGQHSTETQTATYVRRKAARKTSATR